MKQYNKDFDYMANGYFGQIISNVFFSFQKLRTLKWKDEEDPNANIPLPKKVFRKVLWLSGTGYTQFFISLLVSVFFMNVFLFKKNPYISE